MKAKRAIIYTRQSVAKEDTISHEIQENAGRAYAENKGYQVLRVETDPGISGLNLSRRKALARSLESIKDKEAEVLIVWRWSRLSRSRLHQAKLLSDVEEYGGRIESALEPMDSSAAGRFGRDVLLAMAAFESEQKSETWQQAHERRVIDKLPTHGHRYFGYTKTRSGYQKDPVTAPLLREAYALYIAGSGYTKIAKYLNDAGALTVRGNSWDKDMVRKMMNNNFCTGQFTYKRPKVDGEDQGHETIKGAHEAIISMGTWDTYRQKVADRPNTAPRHTASSWALAGLVFCGRCGNGMVKNRSGNNTYLFCSKRRKGGTCIGVTEHMDYVDQTFLTWFGTNAKRIAEAMPGEEVLVAAETAVRDAEALSRYAQENINRLLDRAVRLDLSDSVIAPALAGFKDDLATAEEELRKARVVLGEYTPPISDVDAVIRGLEGMDAAEFKAIVQKVLAGVVVLPNNLLLFVPRSAKGEYWMMGDGTIASKF